MDNDTVQTFPPAFNQFISWCEELLNTLATSEAPPPIIYHYTDDNGLEGIIKTGKLWLTDIFKLNDPSELKHGLSQAVMIFKKMDQIPDKIKTDVEGFLNNIEAHIDPPSICCFSSKKNDLGQWRAYADNGRGYAIGFNYNDIKRIFSESIKMNLTTCIIYDDDKLEKSYTQLFNQYYMIINDMICQGIYTSNNGRNITVLMVVYCIAISLCFKHEAYKNEQEWRFIHKSEESLKPKVTFRRRSYTLFGYIEFDWHDIKSFPLEEIVIGPSADERVAERFIRDCINAYLPAEQAGKIIIDYSRIPYRIV